MPSPETRVDEGHLDRKKTDVDVFERVDQGVHATEVENARTTGNGTEARGWLGGFVVSVKVESPGDAWEEAPDDRHERGAPDPHRRHSGR